MNKLTIRSFALALLVSLPLAAQAAPSVGTIAAVSDHHEMIPAAGIGFWIGSLLTLPLGGIGGGVGAMAGSGVETAAGTSIDIDYLDEQCQLHSITEPKPATLPKKGDLVTMDHDGDRTWITGPATAVPQTCDVSSYTTTVSEKEYNEKVKPILDEQLAWKKKSEEACTNMFKQPQDKCVIHRKPELAEDDPKAEYGWSCIKGFHMKFKSVMPLCYSDKLGF